MHKLNPLKYDFSAVDIHLNNISSNPRCEHGPTILFERKQHNGERKKYFACSACRDRKLCPFYCEESVQNAEDDFTEKELEKYTQHIINYKKFLRFCKKNIGISYCITCSTLEIGKKIESHVKCNVNKHISKIKLQFPSQILTPKSNPKFEAQYLFTEKSLQVIVDTLKNLGNSKVLCVGTPKIHEYIRCNQDLKLKSILLDIDDRYCNFFPVEEFMVYNIFNHYFFGGCKSKQHYLDFISGPEKIILVTDPPFGGRMELLANTLGLIEGEWRDANQLSDEEKLPVLFIFPYFLEKAVKAQMPTLSMLEYQVDYENHALYTKGPKAMKQGSAVRMFTNLPRELFPLPEDEGYRFCEVCNRWVHPRNAHCFLCGDCTSKDGRTYKHCETCKKCVKPAWTHCSSCGQCLPQDHKCSNKERSKQEKGMKRNRSFTDAKQSFQRVKKISQSTANSKVKKPLPKNKTEEKDRNLTILKQIFAKK